MKRTKVEAEKDLFAVEDIGFKDHISQIKKRKLFKSLSVLQAHELLQYSVLLISDLAKLETKTENPEMTSLHWSDTQLQSKDPPLMGFEEFEEKLKHDLLHNAKMEEYYITAMRSIADKEMAKSSKISFDYEHLDACSLLPLYWDFDTRLKCSENLRKKNLKLKSEMKPMAFPIMDYCKKIHFVPLIESHTNVELGDCSYLDTCKNKKQCKYVHYSTESPPQVEYNICVQPKGSEGAEWINWDLLK